MIRSIQYLRGLAASMVIVEHAQQQIARQGRNDLAFQSSIGPAGVDIFFVISGFIMVVIAHGRSQHPTDFWARRVIRVAPSYWIYTMLLLLIYLLNQNWLQSFVLDSAHVIKSFLFIPSFHPKHASYIWPVLVPGWTLNYELFFYFLFGLALYFRRSTPLTVAMLLLAVVLGLAFDPGSAVLAIYTSPLLLEFVAGMLIGVFFLSDLRLSRELSIGMVALSIVLFFGVEFVDAVENTGNWRRAAMWGVPAMLMVAGAVSFEKSRQVPHSPLLQAVGDASYSIYLSHYFTVVAIGIVWGKLGLSSILPDAGFLVVSVVVSIGCGWLAYAVLEQPMTAQLLRLYRRWSSKRLPDSDSSSRSAAA